MAPKTSSSSRWLAADPSKRWTEVFFLAYSPFWILWALCLLVPLQLFEVTPTRQSCSAARALTCTLCCGGSQRRETPQTVHARVLPEPCSTAATGATCSSASPQAYRPSQYRSSSHARCEQQPACPEATASRRPLQSVRSCASRMQRVAARRARQPARATCWRVCTRRCKRNRVGPATAACSLSWRVVAWRVRVRVPPGVMPQARLTCSHGSLWSCRLIRTSRCTSAIGSR